MNGIRGIGDVLAFERVGKIAGNRQIERRVEMKDYRRDSYDELKSDAFRPDITPIYVFSPLFVAHRSNGETERLNYEFCADDGGFHHLIIMLEF